MNFTCRDGLGRAEKIVSYRNLDMGKPYSSFQRCRNLSSEITTPLEGAHDDKKESLQDEGRVMFFWR